MMPDDEMDITLKKAIHHLLHIWFQYQHANSKVANISVSHQCMTAGEDAADFLEKLGLGHDDGYNFVLNDKAREIMNDESLSD